MQRHSLSASTSLTAPSVLGALGLLVFSGAAAANPLGGTVSAGSAAITGQGTPVVQVNQVSDRAVIDWQSFNGCLPPLLRSKS